MAVESIRVVIFDERMYHGHGLVSVWMNRITNRFTREAKRLAPKRSGALAAGIFGQVETVGPRQIEGVIESTAPHTMYVIGGTTGPIMSDGAWANPGESPYESVTIWREPDGGWAFFPIAGATAHQIQRGKPGFFMKLRAGYGWTSHFKYKVRGQAANNFLIDAWRITGHDHRSIRGVVPRSSILDL